MFDVSNKLFHGININNYSDNIGGLKDIDIFERILDTGYLYTRKKIYKNRLNDNISLSHFQSDDEVCLSMHPLNPLFDKSGNQWEDAFSDFIRYNISFIFDGKMLNTRSYEIFGMPGEVRIRGSIGLGSNLVAIGLFDEAKYISDHYNDPNFKSYFIGRSFYRDGVIGSSERIMKRRNIIMTLLDRYNYKLPVVDPLSGELMSDIKVLKMVKDE